MAGGQLYQPVYTRKKVFSMSLPEKKGAAPVPSLAGEAELLPPGAACAESRALSAAARLRLGLRSTSAFLQSTQALAEFILKWWF